jgi:predicted GNAT family acetyltransferase
VTTGMAEVTRNEARHRFEVAVEGEVGVLTYRERDGVLTLLHTEVPAALRGRGLADDLARAALGHARRHGLRVHPVCPFVQAYLRRHPEDGDLVAPAATPGDPS